MVYATYILLLVFIENFFQFLIAVHETIVPNNYNKNYAPSVIDKNTSALTHVSCAVKTITIVDLAAKTMDIKIDAGFYISWVDQRLNLTHFENLLNNVSIFSNKINEKLWYPILRFGNCKECHGSIYEHSLEAMKYDHIKHEIFVYLKHSVTYSCTFQMASYPFDEQVCSIQILQYNYQPIIVDYMKYPNYEMYQVNVPPEWTLLNITETRCDFDSNVYGSCYSFNYHLHRNRARPILLIFIPSALIVILSFLSFWLNASAAAPRVALGLTSILTLTTQFSGAQSSLPAVSTVMALDIWMFVCIFTIFATLIEYSVVNFLIRINTSNPVMRRKPGNYYKFMPSHQMNCMGKTLKIIKKFNGKINPLTIDEMARILFPLIFFVFNLCFWLTFCR